MNNKPSVLITGAAGGIGQALVKSFHQNGYFVIATDVRPLEEKLPADCFIKADLDHTVTDENYAADIFRQIRTAIPGPGLNALVNNAAAQLLDTSENLSRKSWQRTLNVNLLAPFFWTQDLLPELKQAGGCVVNISSIHARLSKKQFVAYATSKAALSALTRNMAIDLGSKIRINAIEPAAVGTDMLVEGFASEPEKLAQLDECHPLGRIAEPDEIADLAVFLCSARASFLQGCIIPANGGLGGRLFDPD